MHRAQLEHATLHLKHYTALPQTETTLSVGLDHWWCAAVHVYSQLNHVEWNTRLLGTAFFLHYILYLRLCCILLVCPKHRLIHTSKQWNISPFSLSFQLRFFCEVSSSSGSCNIRFVQKLLLPPTLHIISSLGLLSLTSFFPQFALQWFTLKKNCLVVWTISCEQRPVSDLKLFNSSQKTRPAFFTNAVCVTAVKDAQGVGKHTHSLGMVLALEFLTFCRVLETTRCWCWSQGMWAASHLPRVTQVVWSFLECAATPKRKTASHQCCIRLVSHMLSMTTYRRCWYHTSVVMCKIFSLGSEGWRWCRVQHNRIKLLTCYSQH